LTDDRAVEPSGLDPVLWELSSLNALLIEAALSRTPLSYPSLRVLDAIAAGARHQVRGRSRD